MTDYKVRLECCGRIVRLRLPKGVAPVEAWLDCEKCGSSTIDHQPKVWQDGTDNMLTPTDQAFETLYDCRTVRREAA